MIGKIKTLFFILLSVFAFKAETATASHAAGAELLYEWEGGSTYTVYFKFYRDCSGVTEANSVSVCYSNACNATSGTLILTKMAKLPDGVPNGNPVTVGCSSYPTRCGSTFSTLPGYREWWYSGTITLPSQCDSWTFAVSISARNSSENINSTTNTNLYVEATLNNKDAPRNSSPYFSVKPVPYVCNGQSYTYNNGASDDDNDSLAFEMINPLEGSTCFLSLPITFAPEFPPLNITTNPFQTNNTFTLDPLTGQISFVPGRLGAQTISIRVKEYRSSKLVGTVMRDIQVNSLNCATTQPITEIDPASLVKDTIIDKVIQVCADVSMSFCFRAHSKDTDAVLIVTDNHDKVIPAAGVYYTGQGKDSVQGCFYWTPTRTDVGLKIFAITIKDSTCKPPGISVSQTISIPINVRAAQNVLRDTAICMGDTITLHPFAGSVFTWSILYGSPDISCVSCANPIVWPRTNTAYTVRTNENAFCGRNTDTVRVIIKREIPDLPTATSNTPVCFADTIRLYGSEVPDGGYIWKGPDGFQDTVRDPIIPNVTFKNKGYYSIQAYSYISQCPSDINNIYVDVLPIPDAYFQYDEHICLGETALIRPDRDYNSTYFWDFAGADMVDTSKLNLHYLSWSTSGEKMVILRLRGQNGCYSVRDTGIINVHDKPDAKIIDLSKNDICTNDTINFSAAQHNNYTYSWLPAPYFTGMGSSAIGIIPQTGLIYLNVKDEWGCSNYDSALVNTYPCCDAFFPNAFTPNGDGKNDAFHVITTGHHEISKFLITNRWGQAVFETTNELATWDGTFHGVPQEVGNYFYYIRYKCSNSKIIEKKGELMLVR